MITKIRIESNSDQHFHFCWDLYQSAFPLEERRPLEYHVEALNKREFHFEVILLDGLPIGFISWWEFDEMIYIEHLATSDRVRGGGYGARVIKQFTEQHTKPIILEVEHPNCDLSIRRIEFYKRLGFTLNLLPYTQPSYHNPKDDGVELLLMTYPQKISNYDLEQFTRVYIPIIHYRNY